MENQKEHNYLSQCLKRIEEELGWGPSEQWTTYDFEKLSELIQSKTDVALSITTLKRVWGRLKYPHAPSNSTLNTLAMFLDYADWRKYVQSHKNQLNTPEPIVNSSSKNQTGTQLPKYLAFAIVPILLLVYIFFISSSNSNSNLPHKPDDFDFKADKILSVGVPNSVIFTYDASNSRTDSVFIVQTWDISRKTLVSKNKHYHSAIYYYPGFFRTKLIVDDQIVKTHDLQIASDGWLALIEEESKPIYFEKKDYLTDGQVVVDQQLLEQYEISLLPHTPRVRFFNQKAMGLIRNDNFDFETKLKSPFKEGDNVCQYVEVLIQCKDDIIIIPLCAEACVGKISLYAAGKSLEPKNNDLSGFGADLSEWTHLQVKTVAKEMTIKVNGSKAAGFTFPNNPTGIVGVQYRFNGPGAVKDTWFEGEHGKVVME